MSLSLSPNSLYRQTTDCTEGGGLTREHCISREKNLSFCHIKLLIIETTNISILFFSQQSLNSLLKG
jgi:hypothetical protein